MAKIRILLMRTVLNETMPISIIGKNEKHNPHLCIFGNKVNDFSAARLCSPKFEQQTS